MDHFILDDDHRPVKVSMMEWAVWFETASRRVARDETEFFDVSTVFLGLDYRYSGDGPPILFETMVFEKERQIMEFFGKLHSFKEEVEMHRYASWDDAVAGHNTILRRLQKQEADAKAVFNKEKVR